MKYELGKGKCRTRMNVGKVNERRMNGVKERSGRTKE
jgi:hypothetical protein